MTADSSESPWFGHHAATFRLTRRRYTIFAEDSLAANRVAIDYRRKGAELFVARHDPIDKSALKGRTQLVGYLQTSRGAPVAQLDRAMVFGTIGWGFESLRA